MNPSGLSRLVVLRQSRYQLGRVSRFGSICRRSPSSSAILGRRNDRPFTTSAFRLVESSSDAKLPPGPITRELLIDPDYEQIALQGKMWVTEGGLKLVDIPQSVIDKGEIPEGYSVDFVLDPLTVIDGFAKAGITDQSQLSQDMVDKLRLTLCNGASLTLMPTRMHELRMALAEGREIKVEEDVQESEADYSKQKPDV